MVSFRKGIRCRLTSFGPGCSWERPRPKNLATVPRTLWQPDLARQLAASAVDRDQKLFLFNQATGEIAESQVVYLRPMRLAGGLGLAAIKFLEPSPGFWGVVFPSCSRAQRT